MLDCTPATIAFSALYNFDMQVFGVISAGDLLKSFKPLHDRVLVERIAAETKTKGGIMLPEKSQGKVLEATVISVGPGARNEKGEVIPMSVKAGDHVLLPEYGGTKVVVEEREYTIFREQDLLGVFH
ncbi:chaperonin GroS [Ancylostoma duodenale]|uniref:10 kDa heat shock protein, mitochondrial n=1 Tax=Ancylostoma duodenale TaxID=51022 RepID=A0A0C2GNC8_9BILA|nr:chaperonin GroS [Ancylostoma duodenale]